MSSDWHALCFRGRARGLSGVGSVFTIFNIFLFFPLFMDFALDMADQDVRLVCVGGVHRRTLTQESLIMNDQLIRIAKEHGFEAMHNLSGGVDVLIPWTRGDESGVDVFPVFTLRQLLAVLNYWA